MRKLALSDEILMSIEKPARYIGGEYNSVMKDKEQVDVRFCMCFPDVYEIGMSHLGFDGLSWQGIADAEQHCIRTVIKRRNRGMKRLTELYDRLARLGALPGVEPSM